MIFRLKEDVKYLPNQDSFGAENSDFNTQNFIFLFQKKSRGRFLGVRLASPGNFLGPGHLQALLGHGLHPWDIRWQLELQPSRPLPRLAARERRAQGCLETTHCRRCHITFLTSPWPGYWAQLRLGGKERRDTSGEWIWEKQQAVSATSAFPSAKHRPQY